MRAKFNIKLKQKPLRKSQSLRKSQKYIKIKTNES